SRTAATGRKAPLPALDPAERLRSVEHDDAAAADRRGRREGEDSVRGRDRRVPVEIPCLRPVASAPALMQVHTKVLRLATDDRRQRNRRQRKMAIEISHRVERHTLSTNSGRRQIHPLRPQRRLEETVRGPAVPTPTWTRRPAADTLLVQE